MFEEKNIEIYSSRDKIREQIIDYAKNYLELESINFTKTGYIPYLINVLSGLTSNLMYYNTATYREFFLVRALQKESVLNLSAMLGYNPDLARASTTQVLIQMNTDFTSTTNIVINGRTNYNISDDAEVTRQPFKFYAGEIPFVAQNDVRISIIKDNGRILGVSVREYINGGSGGIVDLPWRLSNDKKYLYFPVNVVQIEDILVKFTVPKLRPYEFFDYEVKFDGQLADLKLYTTSVDEEIQTTFTRIRDSEQSPVVQHVTPREFWEHKGVASLFLIPPGEKKFVFRPTDKGIKLFFGNNVIGTQLPEGHTVSVVVGVTKGFKGNVLAGTITNAERLYIEDVSDISTGAVKQYPIKMDIINQVPGTGGQDYPTIDEIRTNALLQVQANKRIVTQFDYENVKNIIETLPVENAISVLKRSDLKRNEIALFTDLIFLNEYVPTRNESVVIDEELYPDLIIPSGEVLYTDPNTNEPFINMFDIHIDTDNRSVSYVWVLDDIERSVLVNEALSKETIIYPARCNFKVDRETEQLIIYLSYSRVNLKTEYDDMFASISWIDNTNAQDMSLVTDEELEMLNGGPLPEDPIERKKFGAFKYIMNLEDVAQGKVNFFFEIGYQISETLSEDDSTSVTTVTTNLPLLRLQTDNIIKKNLDEFMYSRVVRLSETKWKLYDVPVLLNRYWQNLIAKSLKDSFTEAVLFKIVTFDMTSYRMLTDFVNLKFSNTWGRLTNMNYNPSNKGSIKGINPDVVPPTPQHGDTWAVTNDINPWSENISLLQQYPIVGKGGFLIKYNSLTSDWVPQQLNTNDIMTLAPDQISGALEIYANLLLENFDAADLNNSNSLSYAECLTQLPALEESEFNQLDINGDGYLLKEELEISLGSGNVKVIYNGSSVVTMQKDIPLKIVVSIWVDQTYPSSSQAIASNVRKNIIQKLYTRTGYDKPIYRSELTKVVQEVPGVSHCSIMQPDHDIFFNYDIYRTFSSNQLLLYSPQLVYISAEYIQINVRN